MSWKFNRGLDQDFVQVLNREYEKGGWWKDALDDRDLILGIRGGYLNVYYRGNSLWRVENRNGTLRVETHFKYLLKDAKHPYIASTLTADGKLPPESSLQTSYLSDRVALKKAAKVYSSEEKEGVHTIAKRHQDCLLDIEVAFRVTDDTNGVTDRDEEEEQRGHVDRIDLAALFPADPKPILRFFEAKRFGDKRLRSRIQPEVLGQLQRYEECLEAHRQELAESYQHVCENLRQLRGMSSCEGKRRDLLESAQGGIEIDTKPVLVIFDYERSQWEAPEWKGQLEGLEVAIGRERILRAGSAEGIQLRPRS